MGKVLRFQTGDGEAAPWRGDPTSMITRCIDETNSETMGCGYLTMSKTAQRSTIDFDEIMILLDGHFRSRCGEETHECAPGDMLWIPADTTFTLECDSAATLIYIKYPAKTAVPPTA